EAFAKAYQDFLQLTQLSRKEFELIIRAELIEQRLQDQFDESIGERGPQKRLSRIRVTDPALADSIRQQLVDGADFVALHAEHSTGDEGGEGDEGGDLGWAALDALPDETADAVRDLPAGEFSEVSVSGLSFDIFLVTEVSDDQPYDADTKSALVESQIAQWLEVEQARVTVKRDLSDGEASWINEQILSRAQAIVAAASG
ncbi:MAG: peptidylprolyl isomerase, partial [Chloroflexi bacterium]|nr:peptidylprolyl isomerase [Chloroflexota bacterium]